MEAELNTSTLSKLKKRAFTFLVVMAAFLIMKWFEPVYEVYLLFYLKVIKGIWALVHSVTFGKLHLIILIVVLINFFKLFKGYTFKQFMIKLCSGMLLIINIFFILWGFNYAQPTLSSADSLSLDQLFELNEKALLELNQLRGQVTDQTFLRGNKLDTPDEDELLIQLALQTDALIPDVSHYTQPVTVFKNGGLRMMGIGGIYFPFSGEALYDGSSPLLRKTFTYAHEYFHAQSVTGEDECNYLAWKTLANSERPSWHYAAYFDLYFTTARLLDYSSDDIKQQVSAAVWSDVEFLRQERKAYATWFHSVSATTNDAYLKMLSSEEGTAAYEGYVKWVYRDLLGTSN
ncbi:MAG: DUF3810 family protein [Flavobacteriales bacterium]